jgi:ATP-dependent Clp protease adapter protein ClpS
MAQEMRSARVRVIDEIRSGSRVLSDVLSANDRSIGRIKVVAVLENVPGLGKVKARRIMDDVGISGDCKVRELTVEHRTALLECIPG